MKKTKRVKKKYTVKTKSRMLIFFLVFGLVISTLGYRLFSNIYQINEMKNQKKKLQGEIVSLNDENEALEADIERLSDSEYIARYVREKYLYSKKGELIIRINEKE